MWNLPLYHFPHLCSISLRLTELQIVVSLSIAQLYEHTNKITDSNPLTRGPLCLLGIYAFWNQWTMHCECHNQPLFFTKSFAIKLSPVFRNSTAACSPHCAYLGIPACLQSQRWSGSTPLTEFLPLCPKEQPGVCASRCCGFHLRPVTVGRLKPPVWWYGLVSSSQRFPEAPHYSVHKF